MNWSSIFSDYINYLRLEKGLSENTIESYGRDLHKLIQFIHLNQYTETPQNISKDILLEFIYQTSKNISARSQARMISSLKSFFDFLTLENYRTNNPIDYIENPKIGIKLPDTLALEEINAIINEIDLSHPQGIRNQAMLEILYSCGLRVSELISLKISDLYFDEGFIKITGKGNKQRLVPITDYTERILKNYLNHNRLQTIPNKNFEDIVFLNRRGNALTRVMIFTIIKDLALQAGIQKKISPHTFRHSFASHLLAGGADLIIIQQLLGHESITTTEIYLHIDKTKLKAVINQFHPKASIQ